MSEISTIGTDLAKDVIQRLCRKILYSGLALLFRRRNLAPQAPLASKPRR